MSNQIIESKCFVMRKTLIGKNQVIKVNFKNGDTAEYNHDEVYEADLTFSYIRRASIVKLSHWELVHRL